jgi:asparagine synthase (glutamine-hydrolysing)
MCSIAGTTNARVKDMVALMKHRAPDDDGFVSEGKLHLGMGRLKIIDLLSEGLCPLQEDGLTLCYNGEIYNYVELRNELKKHHKFRTTSDTEVLLKAWKQWGLKMFDKLNGMYAFALYDSAKKKLILGRDIAGEKPLYYIHRKDLFAFASEAKALAKTLNLTPREDRFFNAFQHCHTTTLWQDVKEVPPAHYLTYDLSSGKVEVKPHWELKVRTINPKTAQEELEDLLEDAVKIRTRADVPYGLYYSRGIDSTILSLLHDFHQKFYFDDEKSWEKDFFKVIDKIVYHLDFPVGSLSSYPLWKLAERASKKVKVVLSGEGADEVFGGYVRYLPIAREFELRRAFPSYSYLFGKFFPGYLDGFARITMRNEDFEFVREQIRPHFERFEDPVNAMGYADFKLILPSLLQMGDRMSGAFGIENRCPFLDRRVVEFGFSLPPELKIKGLDQKIMLRRILEKRGVAEPLKMEKKGLTIIFNKWFNRRDWDRSHYFGLLNEKWREQFVGQKQEALS